MNRLWRNGLEIMYGINYTRIHVFSVERRWLQVKRDKRTTRAQSILEYSNWAFIIFFRFLPFLTFGPEDWGLVWYTYAN